MFSVLLVLLMSGVMAQDALQQMQPRPLKSSHEVELPVPSFGSYGDPQCDENLAMYHHLWTDKYGRTVLLRFSQSGEESTLYKLPEEFADSTSFVDFSVTLRGDVEALVVDQKFHPIIFGFDSEGHVSSHARLEIPDHVTAKHMNVFPNGTVFFSGYYTSDAPAATANKGYVALFQTSGKLIKRLDRLREETKLVPPEPGRPEESATTVGRDGNVYLLTANKVLVISPSGKLQREITFTKPPEFSAVTVQYSDGWLAISFAKPEKSKALVRYLVVNASDGTPLGFYEPTEETGNNNVCFSRHDGFLFMRFENGRVKLITAPLR